MQVTGSVVCDSLTVVVAVRASVLLQSPPDPLQANTCHCSVWRSVKVMAQSASPGWYNTHQYRSQSTEQLDKLLAGLDELSGTLPDLSEERKLPAEQRNTWNSSKSAGNSESDNNSSARRVRQPGSMRSYEDDLDYALEKEIEGGVRAQQPQPYHTRIDSKPFSYIRQNPSRNPSQCSSREGLDSRLESPSLLRKVIGVQHSAGLDLESPPSSPAPAFNNPTNSFHHSQKFSNFSLQENGNKTSSQVNISVNTRPNNSLNISNGGSNSSSGQYNNQSLLSAIKTTSSMLEESVERGFTDRRTEEDRLTWLQKQQRKLEERREEQKRSQQESQYLIKELKTSLQRARSGGTETTDGYVSDAASMLYSETSRESSPAKQSFSVPLRVETDSLYSSVQKRSQRARHDSESEAELANFSRSAINGSSNSIDSAGAMFHPANRSTTPAFPPTASTPYFNQSSTNLPPKSPMFQSRGNSRVDLTARAPSPAGSVYQAEPGLSMSRRGSLSSEPTEVAPSHVKLVKDRNRFWYRPTISREEAISVLRAQPPGTFIVRDSNSFPGAFGLALKVSTLPQNSNRSGSDPNSELVRHFLIEPTSKGVKLKGYPNEPVFASLSALIYQHTITALALPAKLVLPQYDLGGDNTPDQTSASAQMQQLLQLGAACNVFYLFSMDTDQLTGPQAVRKTVSQLFLTRPLPSATVVHFKVSGQGITLTDQARKLFFRKHYNTPQISHCGVDPEDRRWSVKTSVPPLSNRLFAFVARKPTSRACNQCHVFAELDTEQPARAIVNFVNKVMLSGNTNTISSGRAVDMV